MLGGAPLWTDAAVDASIKRLPVNIERLRPRWQLRRAGSCTPLPSCDLATALCLQRGCEPKKTRSLRLRLVCAAAHLVRCSPLCKCCSGHSCAFEAVRKQCSKCAPRTAIIKMELCDSQ